MSFQSNIEIMDALLFDAMHRATLAKEDINAGQPAAAFGALVGIDDLLLDALALYRSAVLIYRQRRPS